MNLLEIVTLFQAQLAHFLNLIPMQVVPDGTAAKPGGLGQGLENIIGLAKWAGLGICVLGLVAAGAMMAINSRRGEGGEHVGRIGMALAGVIVISAAATLVGFVFGA